MHALDILAYQSQFKPVVVAPEPKDRQRAIEARRAAKENGEPTYDSGQSCDHGHVSLRFTGSGYCVECNRIRRRKGKS